jgi:hypothetical protein
MSEENKPKKQYTPLTDQQKRDNEKLYFSKRAIKSREEDQLKYPWGKKVDKDK